MRLFLKKRKKLRIDYSVLQYKTNNYYSIPWKLVVFHVIRGKLSVWNTLVNLNNKDFLFDFWGNTLHINSKHNFFFLTFNY